MNPGFEFKRISAKSIFFFLMFVLLINLLIAQPLIKIGFSMNSSYFLSTSLSGTIGLTLVLTVIEFKVREPIKILKRLLVSAAVCTAVSYFIIYVLHFFN